MQLRISPGGSMLNSLRSRPLEPPSSLTVTTAHKSRIRGEPGSAVVSSVGERTKRFNPWRSVESPVPPPMATTRNPHSRVASGAAVSAVFVCIGRFSGLLSPADLAGLTWKIGIADAQFGAGIGIQKLGEARIFRQILEIGIVARLVAQLRVQAKRLIQPLERVLDVPGQAIESREAVDHEIDLGRLLQQFFEMLAGGDVIAKIHQRHGVVEVLLGRLELRTAGTLEVLVAGIQ